MSGISSFVKMMDKYKDYVDWRIGTEPENAVKYGNFYGYELHDDMLLATNGCCMAFMLEVDEKRVKAVMEKHGYARRLDKLVYRKAIAYPFASEPEHTLTLEGLKRSLDDAGKHTEDMKHIRLPDGSIISAKFIQALIALFNDEKDLEMKTVPYKQDQEAYKGRLVMVRNRFKDTFFYMRPYEGKEPPEHGYVDYTGDVPDDVFAGTLFDLL